MAKKKQFPKRGSNKNYLEFVKKVFQDHFIELTRRFNDDRNINFISKNDKGIFPQIEVESWEDYSFRVCWHKNDIEVKFNDKIIQNVYLSGQYNVKYLRDLFKQITNHEYAHTMQFKSMYYRFNPDTRHILLDKAPQDITVEDIKRCIYSSGDNLVKIQANLKNIHIMYIDQVFQDFWANSIVYEKINDSPPLELLKERYDMIIKNECLYPQNILNPSIRYNQRVFELLLYTQEHFIFNKWDDLVELFNKYDLGKVLRFYRYMNLFFQKILEVNKNYDLMRNDLAEFGKYLDDFDYSELLFKNKFNKEHILILKSYREYLNKK